MSNIVVDTYEPDYMAQMLSSFMQTLRQNLEPQGLCDYFWFAVDSHSITMERKTWLDLVNNLPRLEKQLRTATNHADEVALIIEGLAMPLVGGEIAIYQEGKSQKYLRQVKISGLQYASIMAFVWQIKRVANITTYWTPTVQGTVWTLRTFVEKSQRMESESNLLQHYTRTRQIKWQSNPMIETVMALKDAEGYVVGEKKAAELV